MSRLVYLFADRGITPKKSVGAAASFRSVVRTLTELGHDVLVVSPVDALPGGSARFEQVPTPAFVERLLADVEEPYADAERDGSRKRAAQAVAHLFYNAAVEQTLRRVLPGFRPDAVIERYVPFGVAGVYTSAALGVRHLLNVHAPLAWEGRTFRAQPLAEAAELLEERALAAATRIAVNSKEMRKILTEMGIDSARIVVIPNGVDAALFAPTGPDHRDLLPAGAVVIGFSGSLKAWHGIDVLLESFQTLAVADPRLHLLVVGDGPMRRQVQRLAAEWPERITATGALPLEEVPSWVRTMDIAVTPYPALERFYFSPLKTLEYMAAGRATVSSGIGQLRELVDHGRTGLLVPPGDPEALAITLRRLADDGDLRVSLGAAAAAQAERRHRWADRVAELVEAAVSQPAIEPGRGTAVGRRRVHQPARHGD